MLEICVGTKTDIPEAVDFLMRMHNPAKKKWFEVMADGRHPSTDITNFIIAKDTKNDKIVALIIYQPWNYSYCSNILRGVRLEEVFCEWEYQNQGVLERILEKIAQLSNEKGSLFELVFVGMNGFFNQLGYTFGIPCEGEGYTFMVESVDVGKEYSIVEASDSDIPLIVELLEETKKRNLLTTAIGCKEIDYMKNIYSENMTYPSYFYVIKTS
ncbi:MAG: hypothetical protein FWH06_02370, partial [Oscillospiraceae bacterium]|nr:hypothetical protein [Oscillospiraceae bacterium]